MALKTSNNPANTKHDDACTMAFGRLSAPGCCPRCDELSNGAEVRAGWNDSKIKAEKVWERSFSEHFKPGGKHDQIVAAGGVDTAFEW